MNHLHIGCRVEEIQCVYPSKSKAYPTTVEFRNGHTLNLTGDWHENAAKIDAMLERLRQSDAQEQLADLRAKIGQSNADLAQLRALLDSAGKAARSLSRAVRAATKAHVENQS